MKKLSIMGILFCLVINIAYTVDIYVHEVEYTGNYFANTDEPYTRWSLYTALR